MSKDQIESIADFNELIAFMRENKISDGVWKVLGGNPTFSGVLYTGSALFSAICIVFLELNPSFLFGFYALYQ